MNADEGDVAALIGPAQAAVEQGRTRHEGRLGARLSTPAGLGRERDSERRRVAP